MMSPPTSAFSSHEPESSAGRALFELWAGPFSGRDLAVVSFQGREGISKLFSFEILVVVDPGIEPLDAKLLMQPATLLIQNPGRPPRMVQGMVASVRPEGAVARGRRSYRIRVVPRLWLLKHRVTSRVFQDMSVPDIVSAVLRGAAVPCAWNTSSAHPVRGYCVQYQESDLSFIQRLLAEEGFFFWFEHPALTGPAGSAETVMFADGVQAYPAIATGAEGEDTDPSPHLVLREVAGTTESDDNVHRFELRRAVRPSRVLLRDYDFRRPLLDLRAEAALRANAITATASAAASAPPAAAEDGERDLRIYAHRGDFDEPEVNPRRAQVELEQHRRTAVTGQGTSACRRLLPGGRFHLDAEGSPELGGEYVITHLEHEGHSSQLTSHAPVVDGVPRSYHNRFACVPASVPFRPKRRTRELRQVIESATVVGPRGEDIYTDEHGRIKVQFHWDLEGKRNEQSSCWIRVVQPWAGAMWGSQFIPRVGMEVMVSFLGGDQDCPVVIGSVYNATHPVPFKLPESKTRSGIRTQSVPGPGGSNELSFEDRAGAEQVYLHAQRNLDEVIGHDHTVNVSGQELITIGGSRQERVTGSQMLETVGSVLVQIVGSREEQVAEGVKQTIGKSRAVTVHGMDVDTVKGSSLRTVEQDLSQRVLGSLSVEVGREDKPATADVYAWGDMTLGSGADVVLRAQQRLVLVCGDSRIELDPKGITLHGVKLSLSGVDGLVAKGDGPTLSLGKEVEVVADKVRLFTAKASLELDESAHLNGKEVRLNCDAGDPKKMVDKEGKPLLKHVSLKLTDVELTPYAGKDFILRAAGVKVEGKTDGDGKLEADVPVTATSAEVTLWLEGRPKGPTRRYVLALADLEPAETLAGAQQRLRNLGYYAGKPGQTMDAATRRALRDFQAEHGLKVTGELDAATSAKLTDVHGH